MTRSSFRSGPERSRKARYFLIALLIGLAVAAFFLLRPGPKAEIVLEPAHPAVGPSTPISISVREPSRGLTSVQVDLVQGEQSWALAHFEQPSRPVWKLWEARTTGHDLVAEVGRDHQPDLAVGDVTLRVLAIGDGPLRRSRTTEELVLPVDLEAPALVALSDRPTVRQGGSGAVVYRVGNDAMRHGVRIGDLEVAGIPIPGMSEDAATTGTAATDTAATDQDEAVGANADGPGATPGQHFALYGVPFDFSDPAEIRLFATDEVGNRVELPFLERFDTRTYPHDDIRLSDSFFDKVVPEILGRTPEIRQQASQLESYLLINRELRQRNAKTLAALAQSSRPERLWRGSFDQLPQSSVMANFGDHRSYVYAGEVVDNQVHLGFDLASHRRAVVPASNSGVVVLADYHGIYGNTVVIDHGFGLATLYSHLSEISVEMGDELAKGAPLGRTGVTGLAGGDHLHFTVLVAGVQVDPLEWFDANWIETRLTAVLGPSFSLED